MPKSVNAFGNKVLRNSSHCEGEVRSNLTEMASPTARHDHTFGLIYLPMSRLRFLLLVLLLPAKAFAYPGFIGFGYGSCLTCHYNPVGSGPLTDYGRALSATEIAGHLISSDPEKLANQSGLFGNPDTLPSWFRAGINYRGNLVASSIESTTNTRWINMQADAAAVIQTEDRKYFLAGTGGYAPTPATTPASQRLSVSNFISREHYVGLRFLESFGLYAGFMDIAYGIRIPDHVAYIRTENLLNVNDQSHGVMLHFQGTDWDTALHLLAGNLYQDKSSRQWGASLWTEYEIAKLFRLGVSALYTRSTFRERQLAAIHFRWGIPTGSSVLAQFGVHRIKPNGTTATLGDSIFVQTSTHLFPGGFFLFTFEHAAHDLLVDNARYLRVGPGFQYFPFQRLELRIDFQAIRTTQTRAVNPDALSLLSQVHVWL